MSKINISVPDSLQICYRLDYTRVNSIHTLKFHKELDATLTSL